MTVLCGIIGNLGSGKTLYLVRKAWLRHLRMKRDRRYRCTTYANFKLYPPLKYRPLNLEELINQDVENALVLLDEGYLYMPARRSQEQSNIDIIDALMQIRKRNVDVYWTYQDPKDTERMVRSKATHHVIAESLGDWGFRYTVLKRSYTIGFGLLDEGLKVVRVIMVPMEHAQKLFHLYDTKEIISVSQVKKERQRHKVRNKEEVEA